MVNAQGWLDKIYSQKNRGKVTKLVIKQKNLEGCLDLTEFVNLTELDLLNYLDISDNNLDEQGLSVFDNFINLETLYIGTSDKAKIDQGLYNRFAGSLESLKNCTKLENLGLSNTDIDNGLEYLPKSLRYIRCSTDQRLFNKVSKIFERLNAFPEWAKRDFNGTQELYLNEKDLEGELYLSDFTSLERVYLSHCIDESKIKIKNQNKQTKKEVKVTKLVYAENAQEYLDKNFPLAERRYIKELDLRNLDLAGNLDLGNATYEYLNVKYPNKEKVREVEPESGVKRGVRIKKIIFGELIIDDFPKLEEISINEEKLTQLQISNCPQLTELTCYKNNQLTELTIKNCPNLLKITAFKNQLTELTIKNCPNLQRLDVFHNRLPSLDLSNVRQLEYLDIGDNTFPSQDLSLVSHLVNLEELELQDSNFTSSLVPLQNLTRLERLNISNTDINSDLEDVPKNIDTICCSCYGKEKFKVKELEEQLKSSPFFDSANHLKEQGHDAERDLDLQTKEWLEVGLKKGDSEFTDYLRKENFTPEQYAVQNKNAQEDLEGSLDLRDFTNLEILNCSNNKLVNLDISNLTKLKEIDCSSNKLVNLVTNGLDNLENLNCSENCLTDIQLLLSNLHFEKLKTLELSNNSFSQSDLSPFSKFVNLENLYLSTTNEEKIKQGDYNEFCGSLEPLKDLTKLRILDISNTDIDSGVEYLLENLEKVIYDGGKNPEAKELKIIRKELKGVLDLSDFVNLEELNCHKNELTGLNISNCSELTLLDCSSNQLTKLDLNKNTQLVDLDCSDNELNKLDLSGLNITKLNCQNNSLTKFNFLILNPEIVERLDCSNNDFSEQDLSSFTSFTNLKYLAIGTNAEERIEEGIYNRFMGSLESLKNCTKLEKLYINNTDINFGLEYLPNSVEKLNCFSEERKKSQVKQIEELLKDSKVINLSDLKTIDYLESELVIADFPKLKEIKNSGDVCKINKVTVKNCPRLEDLEINRFKDNKELNIDDCSSLKGINCSSNQLVQLNVQYLPNLEKLNCSGNLLTNLDISQNLLLKKLNISNNDFSEQDLNFLSHLVNLEELHLENSDEEKFKQNIYNRFHVSLKYLKNLDKLKILNISNTDINDGQEYLSDSVEKVYCSDNLRDESNCKAIAEKLKDCYNKSSKYYSYQDWIKVGQNDKENYGKRREEITKLNIDKKNLEGSLILEGFTSLESFSCFNNKLTELDVSNCLNLKEFNCCKNQLTSLDISKNSHLVKFACSENQLTNLGNLLKELDFSALNSEELESLNISSNNFPQQDLSFLDRFTNLKYLQIGNYERKKIKDSIYNRFFGSLELLRNLTKLEELDISNTDINQGIEYLPNSITEIYYSIKERKGSKLIEIAEELSGKSALANLLVNKKENFEEQGTFKEEFIESDGSVVKTKSIQISDFRVKDEKYQIIDTVGIGSGAKLKEEEIVREIFKACYEFGEGLLQVLFVIDKRVTLEEIRVYNIIRKKIFDDNITKYTTIVRTHFGNFRSQEKREEDENKLKKANITKKMVGSCRNIIYIDNPSLSSADNEAEISVYNKRKKESRDIILRNLAACQDFYKPSNLKLINEIFRDYVEGDKGEFMRLLKEDIKRLKNESFISKKLKDLMVKKIKTTKEMSESSLRAAIEIRNNCLQITGNGKSTLANVIAKTGEFKEGEFAVSETKKIAEYTFEHEGMKYRIVDTVGIGDTKMTMDKVLNRLALMGYSVKDGLSQILFVTDGKLVEEPRSTYELLKKVVFDDELANYTTIVRTNFPDFRKGKKCEEERQNMIENSESMKELIEECKNEIIFVDNPPIDIANDEDLVYLNKKRREESRERLLNHLKNICHDAVYKPENLVYLSEKLSKHVNRKEKLKKGLFNFYDRAKSKSLSLDITNEMKKLIEKEEPELKEYIGEGLKQLEEQKKNKKEKPRITNAKYISCNYLEGKLDLTDFIDLEKLYCQDNEITGLLINSCEKLTKIDCSYNPLVGSCETFRNLRELKILDIKHSKINGGLECLPNGLERFFCTGQLQKELEDYEEGIEERGKFVELNVKNKELKKGLRLIGFVKLERLNCSENHITKLDLSDCPNLKFLDFNNCPLEGSLKFLKSLKNLEELNITNTNLSEGLEHLPIGFKKLYCNSDRQYKSTKLMENKQNGMIAKVIPLERLYVIRGNIRQFLKNIQAIGRGVAIAGAVLTFQDKSAIGGGILAIYPLAELIDFLIDADSLSDNFNELSGMLSQFKISELKGGKVNEMLKNLDKKTTKFLKAYDENGDNEIDVEELKNEKKKAGEEESKLQAVMNAIKELERAIVGYRQISYYGMNESTKEEESKEIKFEEKPTEATILVEQ
ncbi:17491_t:CDS:10 [Funneliformis geosporum]|uniref:17491_t:CDS:1 n=1 Tax=Funneliformis geosporum TaxID=1117311 RepID=A0A9W4WWV3_9GLOM|nr:17491_t:CDS:10 [Funneliformis geosporum]